MLNKLNKEGDGVDTNNFYAAPSQPEKPKRQSFLTNFLSNLYSSIKCKSSCCERGPRESLLIEEERLRSKALELEELILSGALAKVDDKVNLSN